MNKQNNDLMMRVLITGMSGTGKSKVIVELRKRGFQAIDMDECADQGTHSQSGKVE